MTAERDRLAALISDFRRQNEVHATAAWTSDDRADRLIAAGVHLLDSIPPDMTDYMAGYRQARADLAAAIEQRLRDQPTPPRLFALSAWDLDCVLGIIREVAYGPVT